MTEAKQTTTRVAVPDAFWQGLDLIGLTPSLVLRQARLPATLHMGEPRDRRRVTIDEFFQLWRAVEELNPDPTAGIRLATALNTAVLPPSSLVAFYAKDYRDGLQRMARFKQLCAPERMHLVERGGLCTVTTDWLHAKSATPRLLIDASFAWFVELGRRGTGVAIVPKRVELARPDVRSGAFGRYFGCPIIFDGRRDALVLDSADLDRPFPGHNPELLAMLNPPLSAALSEAVAPTSVTDHVKSIVKRFLPSGRPEMAAVAQELGMSGRTLQRRITEEGGNYRQLVMEARQELVRHLLIDPSTEINDIAYLLGYEDANSFYRAFHSWEGTTPSRWRERQGAQTGSGVAH